MNHGRRELLLTATGLGVAGRVSALGRSVPVSQTTLGSGLSLEQAVLDLFSVIPDRKALKIWSPSSRNSEPEFLVQLHEAQRMFVASTNKSIILCERLRQLDSPSVGKQIADRNLTLDESVWSPGSVIFNPPRLSGIVSERTAMEAMIVHSDNTGTDMVLRQAGADRVRDFIARSGLKSTMIPDSTRAFGGYVLGAPNYKTITYQELVDIKPSFPLPHPFLNDVETLASSAEDLVSFFSRALQGKFFGYEETLFEFRRILALGDIAYLVPFALGANVFGKAGYADTPGSHARSIAGAIYFPERWVYFSAILNWDAEQGDDPETVRAFYGAIRRSMELIQQGLGKAA